ncbi:MAG: ATP-binding protein [Dehalococcoidia bacterium]|nr:MAG: ATP-binding protein [Dehalococcoidia bacterium]
MSAPLLNLRAVRKEFPLPGSPPLVAVERVDLSIERGEFIAIIGPSGCGKSTVLELIAGIQAPTSGEIRLDGELVMGPHPDIGMVFQEDSTLPWRTVLENVAFGLEVRGIGRRERLERARTFIQLVGLAGFEQAYPAELSGGMRQRVAIARTLAMLPQLLLLDEPFGALDQQTRLLLGDELLRIWQETRATILLVTHSLDEAALLADRIVVMTARPGRVKQVIPNPLPRPRSTDVLDNPAFAALTAQLWRALRQEAITTTLELHL